MSHAVRFGSLPVVQWRILDCLQYRGLFGMTAAELMCVLELAGDGVRVGLRDLVEVGLVSDSGRKRKNSMGHAGTVWVLADPQMELPDPFSVPKSDQPEETPDHSPPKLRLVGLPATTQTEVERRQMWFTWGPAHEGKS